MRVIKHIIILCIDCNLRFQKVNPYFVVHFIFIRNYIEIVRFQSYEVFTLFICLLPKEAY